MIRALMQEEYVGLNGLVPSEWRYDYEAFLREFKDEDFFHAFVIIEDRKIIGTGNVLIKGAVAWLANIIVDKKSRGKGLGYKMTQFLVDFADKKGCETQLLIATDLGEPVYRKIGFTSLTEYLCFDSVVDVDYQASPFVRELKSHELALVMDLDRKVNGEDRSHLISKFIGGGVGYFSSRDELLGFYLPCFGRGLVVALDDEAGVALLKLKHAEKGRRSLLPVENKVGVDFFEQGGFKKGLACYRMFLGKEIQWNPQCIYSYASGYCG